ncbi:MAG: DUF177 domain-containing protein [Victivallales bacterium]|nr:DUF177 domain-containing protein [Victivallales bacterium]
MKTREDFEEELPDDGVDYRMGEGHASSPLLIVQVANMPDEGVSLHGEVPFSDLELESDERFDLTGPVEFDLHIQPVQQEFVVRGKLHAVVQAMCDRCTAFAPCHLTVKNVFHCYKNNLGEPIDLTEDVREDILLSFPQSFRCREDCKGLCPTCGRNLNEGTCDCKPQDQDDDGDNNPWNVLSNLKLDET